MKTIIRVGEKNNFNQTDSEYAELKKYSDKGLIFVNSNSFNPIQGKLPSFITINPYMTFEPLKGDLSNVKAVRIKLFLGKDYYMKEINKCIKFCVDNNLKILITYMRFSSKNSISKYCGDDYRNYYKWNANYFRPLDKKPMLQYVESAVELYGKDPKELVFECDGDGQGCPTCMNCSFLSYGIKKDVTIKALNLSISGVKDVNGNKGLCSYNCPDCFAKKVCYGKRPQCDKLITNRKISGELKK